MYDHEGITYLLLLMTMRMPYLGFHAKFFECNQSNKENFHSANFKETRNLKKWKNLYDIFKYHHTQYNNNNMRLIFFSWPILKLPYLKLVRHFMIECCVLPKSHINSKPNWKATAKAHWAKFGKEYILLEMYVFGD